MTLGPPGPHLTPETMLQHAGWIRSIARALLRDDSRAEDVVQQTWLAALERPLRDPAAIRAWLSRVVRNLSLRARRSEERLRRREMAAARPEAQPGAPSDLLERAELSRIILDGVLSLDEPYRSTLLLRYYEDRDPARIAEMQGVPVATVRTRIHRALERLRSILDRAHGGARAAWVGALLPLAGLDLPDAAAALATGAVGAPSAAPSAVSSAGSSAFSSAAAGSSMTSTTAVGGTALTLGGIVMAQKSILMAGFACALALAAGFGIGKVTTSGKYERMLSDGELLRREDYEQACRDRNAARERLAAAEEALRKSGADADGLRAQVAKLKSEDDLRKAAEARVAAAAKGKRPPVSFGKYGELEGLASADWKEIGAAARKMNELLLELIETVEKGGSVTPDLQKRIRDENNKLVGLAAGLMGKIPTHSPVNGEYSHPVCLSNMIAALLETSGQPLTEEQKAEIARLGAEYEGAYDEAQKEYGDGTPLLRKFLDELELKAKFRQAADELLTDDQRGLVGNPAIRDRMQVDILSPFTMAILMANASTYDSADAMRNDYARSIAEQWGLSEEQRTALQPALDGYFAEVQPLLESGESLPFFRLQDALVAARAHAKVVDAALGLPGLSDKARSMLLGSPGWTVPQLKKKAE